MFAAGVEEQTVPAAFVARKVAVGSYKLKLEERDGKCDLVFEGRNHKGTITLDIASPCEFLRERNAKVQLHRYWNRNARNGGVYLVILVIGGPPDKAKPHPLMKDGCATQTQAVSLSSRGVVAGAVGTGVVVCPLDGLDEVFVGSTAKPI